jgi:hypothetical protein
MRQAADILASPAAMQIRQLEALQSMAKSANSKVIFVPMHLQGDVGSQISGGSNSLAALVQNEASDAGLGPAGRAGILNSVSEV